jgi:hypothetical protein
MQKRRLCRSSPSAGARKWRMRFPDSGSGRQRPKLFGEVSYRKIENRALARNGGEGIAILEVAAR